ncbi:MAG: phenylacetate--CoA ligase [Actinobacteria bacterium RBG_16_64_13]|nr:MAG: phenylacetate--CoA ligase [Actinobacteria bacterium RBG_16_64_13]
MIFDRENECMRREDLRKLQEERLKTLVKRVYDRVPFYTDLFDKSGIKPEQVRRFDDLARLPFTRKYNLRDEYPFGLFATPLKEVVRIHASSGTTGKPTTVGYTRNDIAMWAEVCARSLAGAGTTDDDVVQVAYGYGLFTGGLGAHYGAELIGASVIPISGSNTQRQLMLMQDFGTTVLCCTPTFALYVWDVAQQLELDVTKFPLKVGVFGAEPWSEAMRHDIERKWNIKACDIYGLSEIIGPGVSCECVEAQSGLHLADDHFLPEIIDSETGEVLPEGEWGELVITTLTKEAFPLVRYRTGDITRLSSEPCVCGRTNTRMDRISGRTDDMLIIRGVNVFPSQVESVLLMTPQVEPHYKLIVTRKGALDNMDVQVEIAPGLYKEVSEATLADDDITVFTEHGKLLGLKHEIQKNIKDIIGINVGVTFKEPGSIERSEGKAQRVLDMRNESSAT